MSISHPVLNENFNKTKLFFVCLKLSERTDELMSAKEFEHV